MNIQKLNEAVQYFIDEPLRFNMSSWVGSRNPISLHAPPCGTVACIGGAVILAEAKLLNCQYTDLLYKYSGQQSAAMAILEIDNHKDANRLFHVTSWPKPLGNLYMDLQHKFMYCLHPHVIPVIKQMIVMVLEERVELFIRTNGKE